jgi:sugar lactone lactonase YvrE
MIGLNGAARKIIDLRHPRFLPGGIAVDSNGNLLIADTGENRILKLTPSGEMESLAKGVFLVPSIIGLDGDGGIYVFDRGDDRIRKLTSGGGVESIVGGGRGFAGDGGPAASSTLSDPAAVALDNAGNLYVLANERVRRVTPDGLIQTIAGNGAHGSPADPTAGYAGDGGPAIEAALEGAQSIALDPAGALYITHHGRIRKVQPDGLIRTFAGPLQSTPDAIAADSIGNLYAAAGGAILKFNSDGVVVTLQSVPGASIGSLALAIDGQANLWVAEQLTQTIYQFTSDRGLIPLAQPVPISPLGPAPSIAGDTCGNLYLSDTWNSAIYRISADGLTQRIAGNGDPGFDGDGGPASSSRLAYPLGIAVDANGSVFVADSGNHRVRKLTPSCQ